jgi:hypothetical protein
VWSITGRLLETLQASVLDLPDLITDEPPAHHVATQLSQGVGRDRFALGGAQAVKAFGGLLQLGIEAADAEPINAAFIRLTIRLCSPTRLSCSRLGRLASSSLIVGIATILQ